jgi:hypothetical protein
MLILGSPFHVMMCCSGYPPDSFAVHLLAIMLSFEDLHP